MEYTAYPIDMALDPKQIRIDFRPATIGQLIARSYRMPAGVMGWPLSTQSAAIESILIRLPQPQIFFVVCGNGQWFPMNQVPYLITLNNFVQSNGLRLESPSYLPEVDGQTYRTLPMNLQRRFLETVVPLYVMSYRTDFDVLYDIYLRINPGADTLTNKRFQQLIQD